MKELNEMVWPVENYTDKIHTGLGIMFKTYNWLTFTTAQMEQHLTKGYSWLKVEDQRQRDLLKKIITTGIRKLIQANRVKKVTSNVSTEAQWIAVTGVENSAYTSVTSQDEVATTDIAKKKSNRRAVGARALWKLNHSGSVAA